MLTEKDYCDYETCVALRELGYNAPQRLIPDYFGVFEEPQYDERIHLYDAKKWLREEKDIHIEVFFSLMNDKRQLHYDWHIVHNIRFDDDEYTYDCDVLDSMGSYKSYEEALSEGIKKAVKILKESL